MLEPEIAAWIAWIIPFQVNHTLSRTEPPSCMVRLTSSVPPCNIEVWLLQMSDTQGGMVVEVVEDDEVVVVDDEEVGLVVVVGCTNTMTSIPQTILSPQTNA